MHSTPDRVLVAEAGEDDVADVAAAMRAAWDLGGPDTPGFTGATDEVIEDLTRPVAIRARLGGPDRRMFLARLDGRPIGFAATRRLDTGRIELAGIIVVETATGRGVGSLLVDLVVATARADGAGELLVRTEIDNERAIGFYEHAGFTRRGVAVEDVDGTHVDVVELVLRL